MQGRQITKEQFEEFFKRLRLNFGNVSRAAELAGFSRFTAYEHKKADPEFSARWDAIIEGLADDAEKELHRRAVKGVMEPKFYKGKKVANVRKFSDQLLMFMLKAKRPDIYRERMQMDTNVKGSLDVSIVEQIDRIYDDNGDDG